MVFYVSEVAGPRQKTVELFAEPFSTKIAAVPVYRIPSTHFKTPLEPLHVNMIREKSTKIYEHLRTSAKIIENQRKSMNIYEHLRES